MTRYPYGYCGMPCALCTRYRTDGKSRCEGCSNGGYYTDVCKVHHCCIESGSEHCGNCADFPCRRLGKMGDFKDLNTDNVKIRTCSEVSSSGLSEWYNEYEKRADMLTEALSKYNDGRMKRYLCELFIQNEATVLSEIMRLAEGLTGDKKEVGKGFRTIADKLRRHI